MKKLIAISLFVFVSTQALAADVMQVKDVKRGMKGYGLTVFQGTEFEKFDVEILGVLENIGPGQNLILAHVDHPVVKKSGVIAGMSGSPIYIDGKVIGALAYSWQFSKDSIAGITPIQEMLLLDRSGPAAAAVGTRIPSATFLSSLGRREPAKLFEQILAQMTPARSSSGSGALPIATPVSFGSFAAETMQRFSPALEASGLLPVSSGSSSPSASVTSTPRTFAPGDAIAAVLLDGDFSVAASGTVSYVDGDKVYGFGHPFLDMGEINLPMARSEVVTVLPSVSRSFKFSNTREIVGTLRQDRAAGIMGVVGEKANMVPVRLTLQSSRGKEMYNLRAARHPQLLPLLLAMVSDTVVSSAQKAAGERTVMLDATIGVRGQAPIHLREGWAGQEARQAIPAYLALVANYLLSNEFSDAVIEDVSVTLSHEDDLRTAKLIEASLSTPGDGQYNPGDKVTVRALLKPFRGESFVENFELTIPQNQAPGPAYLFVGSGTATNQLDFMLVPPDPRSLAQVISVIDRLHPSTSLVAGLYAASEGAVAGGIYHPELPPSMQAVIRSDSNHGAQVDVKYRAPGQVVRKLAYVVDGAMKLDLQVRPKL